MWRVMLGFAVSYFEGWCTYLKHLGVLSLNVGSPAMFLTYKVPWATKSGTMIEFGTQAA